MAHILQDATWMAARLRRQEFIKDGLSGKLQIKDFSRQRSCDWTYTLRLEEFMVIVQPLTRKRPPLPILLTNLVVGARAKDKDVPALLDCFRELSMDEEQEDEPMANTPDTKSTGEGEDEDDDERENEFGGAPRSILQSTNPS